MGIIELLSTTYISKLDSYPIPKADDLFTALAGGKLFSKLDLSYAYLQLMLDEESRKFTTINTQKGLFQYKRLPLVFHLPPPYSKGLWTVYYYRESPRHVDILITGTTVEEHLRHL